LTEGEKNQLIQFNPNAALQKRIFADGFVPNSKEFGIQVSGTSYAAQRAENLEEFKEMIKEMRLRKEREREFEQNQRTAPPPENPPTP
jgi:hypothetical protein